MSPPNANPPTPRNSPLALKSFSHSTSLFLSTPQREHTQLIFMFWKDGTYAVVFPTQFLRSTEYPRVPNSITLRDCEVAKKHAQRREVTAEPQLSRGRGTRLLPAYSRGSCASAGATCGATAWPLRNAAFFTAYSEFPTTSTGKKQYRPRNFCAKAVFQPTRLLSNLPSP